MSEHHTLDLHLLALSGELSRRQREAMKRHLRDCTGCEADLQQIQQLLRDYDAIDQPAPPAALLAGLRTRARQMQPEHHQHPSAWLLSERRWLQTAAVIALLILAAVLYRNLNTPHPAATAVGLHPAAIVEEAQLQEMQRKTLLLATGSIKPGSGLTNAEWSDALIDDELKAIRSRMNDLARGMLVE